MLDNKQDVDNDIENDEAEYEAAFEEFANKKDGITPEPKAETEAKAEEETEEEASVEEATEEDDPLSLARQEIDQWKHKYNSDIGRVNAYQRQIQDLQKQLSEVKTTDNPKNSGVSDEEWESLVNDYPDIAQAIESKTKQQESLYMQQLQQLQQQIAPLQQAQTQQMIDFERQKLTQSHPDWQDICQSEDFTAWLNQQPEEVQSYIGSTRADHNIYLLDAYKAMTGSQSESPLSQKREKQLQQSKTVSNRSTVNQRDVVPDDDYEAAFEYYANKKDSRASR